MLEVDHLNKATPENTLAGNYESKLENFAANHEWRALHALVEYPEFNPSPVWIAKALGTTVENAVSALEGLVSLGLIEQTQNGSYKSKKLQLLVPQEMTTKEHYVQSHLLISRQIQSICDTDTVAIYRSTFQVSNSKIINKLKDKIKKSIQEFMIESEEAIKLNNIDGLYAIEITSVNYTNNTEN